ncbi:MAG: DEAD/DEAH box helicase, partial [Flammeovirgaceae bacterium]|nr:DEAD/DEAH box helicase [Flammeovirgaceae bacterium]
MADFFDTSIEYLKGVGPQRAALLQKELKIFTFGDLIQHYPFRHEDRTKFFSIKELSEEMPYVQVKGKIVRKELVGAGRKKRLSARFQDETGEMELVWFQGINWVNDKVKIGVEYVAFGKPARYGNKFSIAHPELDVLTEKNEKGGALHPIYPLSEKLRARHFDSRAISKLVQELLRSALSKIRETLSDLLLKKYQLISKQEAIVNIHFPQSHELLTQAQQRLKYEELFYVQLRLLKLKVIRKEKFRGQSFQDATLLTKFYNQHLPFPLTGAQKKVIKEIYADLKSGKQMNRLLQGDVGSGKTIVAFICMLIAIGGGAQCTLMAPTEILAQQHYNNLKKYADTMQLTIALLMGSVKKSDRKHIHTELQSGELKILIGTHALIEEEVQFKNLGLAIVDEQHRFGVAQRSKLWQKNSALYPHILVMTATPIPRTLEAQALQLDRDTESPQE